MVAFHRPTNIKDLVVRSSPKAPSIEAANTGFSPCKQCTACKHQHGGHRIQHTVSSNSITSTTTEENFTIRHSLNCLSTNIIYVIICKRCSQQYVGETKRTLKQRLLEHCGDAKNKREKPVARHFNLPGHSRNDITIMAVDRPGNTNQYHRLALESKWIKRLKTTTPLGINIKGANPLWFYCLVSIYMWSFWSPPPFLILFSQILNHLIIAAMPAHVLEAGANVKAWLIDTLGCIFFPLFFPCFPHWMLSHFPLLFTYLHCFCDSIASFLIHPLVPLLNSFSRFFCFYR